VGSAVETSDEESPGMRLAAEDDHVLGAGPDMVLRGEARSLGVDAAKGVFKIGSRHLGIGLQQEGVVIRRCRT